MATTYGNGSGQNFSTMAAASASYDANKAKATPVSSYKPSAPVPAYGTKGQSVKNYQSQLNTNNSANAGYVPIKEDGVFGPKTLAASQYKPLNTQNQSTTTLSSDKTSDIANNTNTLDGLNDKGVRTDASGNTLTADGNLYQEPKQADTSKEDDQIQNYFDQMKSSLDATTKGMIDNAQQKYDQLKQEQADINKRAEAGTQNSLLMGGVTGQGSSAQYAPISSGGIIQAQASYGLKQIAALDSQENDAIAQAQQYQQQGEFQLAEKQIAIVQQKRAEKIAATTKLNDLLAEQTAKAQERNQQIAKEDAISKIYDSGTTDPSEIRKQLSGSGMPVTAKEAADTVALLSGQGGSGIVGEYNFYVADAKKHGQVPVDFNTYQNMDANRKQKAITPGLSSSNAIIDSSDPNSALGVSKQGGSILSHTGLSLTAFNYLTQGTGALTRLSAGDRTKIMNETQDWLNTKGIDVSTFKSQYEAYNTALQKNIERANNTKIFAGEVEGSADALISAIDEKDMGNIKAKNIIALEAGKQVNNPTVQKYSFQLKAMANDLAGYFAASRNATSPDDSDKQDAADVISNGLSKRSVDAFKDSVHVNEQKVNGVVNNAVQSTQKQVWDLFGVGDQYKAPNDSTSNTTGGNIIQSENDAKNTVLKKIAVDPSAAKAVRNAVIKGYSYSDIISAFPEYFK